jgi:hypothetical protein
MQLDFSGVDELNKHITKEEILSKITPREIFEFYLGHSIDEQTSILSPFRHESHPSFTFKFYSDGHVLAKDWGTGEKYDCFNLVSKLTNKSFTDVLKDINKRFSLDKDLTLIKSVDKIESVKIKKKRQIHIKEQPYTKVDIDYWKQYFIDIKTLVYYNVKSCKKVWLDEDLIFKYTSENPLYAYKFESFKSYSYKIYRPFGEKKRKWLFNGSPNDMEGYDQLPWYGDLLIITKSLKDVMCYYNLGFNAISLQGENNTIDEITFETLSKRFKTILVNFDNDKAGNDGSQKLCEKFNLERFFIPEELGTKDLSDTIKTYGIQYTTELLNSII